MKETDNKLKVIKLYTSSCHLVYLVREVLDEDHQVLRYVFRLQEGYFKMDHLIYLPCLTKLRGHNWMPFAVQKLITITRATFVQKNSQIRTLIKQSLEKYRFLKKLPLISDVHKNCYL